jgi:hypothetical protein
MSQIFNAAVFVVGIDIGKNSFHVVGHDERGAIVLRWLGPFGNAPFPIPPGHRRRSPAPGSHRTWRAALPHHALRQLVHSTASACSFP